MRLRFFILGILLFFVTVITMWFVGSFIFRKNLEVNPETRWGFNFSEKYADEIGIDWQSGYLAMLEDFPDLEYVRLSATWDLVEPEPGVFDFSRLDWLVNEAGMKGRKVLLAVGRKLPRWPECQEPEWARPLSKKEMQASVMAYVAATVERYRDNPAVFAWQVENEPFFPFGDCKNYYSLGNLSDEISLVRTLDSSRKVFVTDTGEFSLWFLAGIFGDEVGINEYFVTANPRWGYVHYPFPVWFYKDRISLFKSLFGKNIFASELQIEPWFTKSISETSTQEQLSLSNEIFIRSRMDFASKSGASPVYLWGMEWAYWAKENGHPEIWEAIGEGMGRE
ncbi:MAG: beta-1,4-xylanase [Parcubacteria group bacterium Gr01-1014_18]|nr:MAG: beta-1,4-xylanase [Parcubacteria group bacterium Greene0416_36]TSC81060.1 MAG: beta-1,4-xylanase [Parcubacteria group bacterium Gr01-1014_18]TSC98794.1 MAG: beta-1,4-xylanase [Parcubacteria group bacterium Greene1014_20]TSD06726.1 MAG: beta-1,4-xylanase [Parcubacteria group bacterium Greene0714_2]